MGIFGKKSNTPPSQGATNPGINAQALHDQFVIAMMEYVEPGLESAKFNDLALRTTLTTAISALTSEAVKTGDEALSQLILRICASYGINDDTELTNERWGKWMFDDVCAIKDYRDFFLSQGKRDLEQQLSLLATMQTKVLERGPRYEAVMMAVKKAAGEHLGRD